MPEKEEEQDKILLEHFTNWTISVCVFSIVFAGLFILFLMLYLEKTQVRNAGVSSIGSLQAHQIHPMKNGQGKILLVYSYHESERVRAANLQYFINHGMILNSSLIDYVFVIANSHCSVAIPLESNVRIISRPNQGWDFGNWSAAIQQIKDEGKLDSYNCFAFLNDSVRGPFSHQYPNSLFSQNWLSLFSAKLNDQVLLVGPTINCQHSPHVQTYCFLLNEKGFEIATKKGIFNAVTESNTVDLIQSREIGLSKAILDEGYNIDCILSAYKGIDWKITRQCNHFEGADLNPTESPFEAKRTVGKEKRNRNYLNATDTIFAKCKIGHHGYEAILDLCE